ncbi:MAG: glyoxalase [Flavobacterium sp.]
MNQRTLLLNELRGETIGIITTQSSNEETFQNQVLRPILKLQNDLFLAVFENYIHKNKKDFHTLTTEKKMLLVENAIQKDAKFRNSLKGMVIGLYTLEEYQTYSQNSSNLNKRMMTMLIERIKSQIQLFEKQV